jgi:aryl-alcohol dehydrogenase-like predicted oxidoreductase
MKYRKLGKNGPEISVIGFGSWAIGGGGWASAWGDQDDQLSMESVRAALDSGVTFYDTAAVYGLGHSEEVIGQALKGDREKVILATKCGLVWDENKQVSEMEPSIPSFVRLKLPYAVSEQIILICTRCIGQIRTRMLQQKKPCGQWIN